MNEPTPEDLSRDLLYLLGVCEQAPNGPWINGSTRNERSNVVTGPGGLEITAKIPGEFYSNWKRAADFVAAAREGMPAAIRLALHYRERAEKAEAEVARLKALHLAACERIAQQSDALSRRAEK